MKKTGAGLMALVAAAAMGLLAAGAGAQCLSASGWKAAVKPAAWTATNSRARLMRAGYGQASPADLFAPIVGMWHVNFVAAAINNPESIPLPFGVGDEFDAGFQQWHNDGTEMLNSGRAPATGSFCMGVWEQVGLRTFKLNHIALSWQQGLPDQTGAPANIFLGPASITEVVTVSPNGKSFSGKFTLSQYGETDASSGTHRGTLSPQPLFVVTGPITATRVGVNTPLSPVF